MYFVCNVANQAFAFSLVPLVLTFSSVPLDALKKQIGLITQYAEGILKTTTKTECRIFTCVLAKYEVKNLSKV